MKSRALSVWGRLRGMRAVFVGRGAENCRKGPRGVCLHSLRTEKPLENW